VPPGKTRRHLLFCGAGLGATFATALLTIAGVVVHFVVDHLIQGEVFQPLGLAKDTILPLPLVAFFGELIHLVTGLIPVRFLSALPLFGAVPVGYFVFLLLVETSDSQFSVTQWLALQVTWTFTALVVSGLLPAALSLPFSGPKAVAMVPPPPPLMPPMPVNRGGWPVPPGN